MPRSRYGYSPTPCLHNALRCLLLALLVVTDQAVYPQGGQAPQEDVEGQEEIDVERGD